LKDLEQTQKPRDEPVFFSDQEAFRQWLSKNHQKEKQLLVGFHKVHTGKPCMTWSESVDQALCFGWIDGVRKSTGEDSYTIRFTPRKPSSIWSAINIAKVEELMKQGLMKPAGMASFNLRKEHRSKIYSHENDTAVLTPDLEKKFKRNKKAWTFFAAQPPSYRKVILHWIMSAKQKATQISRLEKTIAESEKQNRVV